MPELWTKEKEIQFFKEAGNFATPEQLFYVADDSRYYAYWPKSYKGKKTTLQSRNALIGNFTEKFSVDLLQDFANSTDIKAIFEVKMSVVWNWELRDNQLICLGDFKTHKGNPGLLRSDSMLKAIGKSINIRVSSYSASVIPIIVLGNTPISQSYNPKVDHLYHTGIIQGFWSVNPNPLDNNGENLKQSPDKGFIRMDSYEELLQNLENLLSEKREFFSSMKSKKELGKIIEIANKEPSYEEKAAKFLSLIRD